MNVEEAAFSAFMVYLHTQAEKLIESSNDYLCYPKLDELSQSLEVIPKYTEQISRLIFDIWTEMQISIESVIAVDPNLKSKFIAQYEDNNIFNAKVVNDSLYVLMPRPGKRRVRAGTTPYIYALRNYLYYKTEGTGFSLDKIQLRIMHVFPLNTNPFCTIDNDNYETKAIIDLICDIASCSDCGLNCSLLIESIATDELMPATYVIAELLNEQYCTKSEAIRCLKRTLFNAEK